jgi:hypothetical protein
MRTCLYMGRYDDHHWHVCVRGDYGVTWQRDWESGSYVELSQAHRWAGSR